MRRIEITKKKTGEHYCDIDITNAEYRALKIGAKEAGLPLEKFFWKLVESYLLQEEAKA